MNRTQRIEEPLVEQALNNAYESNFDNVPGLTPEQRQHWEKALAEGEARVALANQMLGNVAIEEPRETA